ncbi:DoxX family protein [Zhouia spongiae]|uniref:DoxX family protein n=1 Tax=Zhouia spongiae TaxID=2202721 RepID=A0ABY3YIZ8_9FLAO|nr:DoxX family protein [Zhouia spongiae]UNY97577.1 DoxX family protein [Zhouia spongiae]
MKKKNYYIERIAAFVAAIILLQTLYYKFTGHPDSIKLFTELGVEPYGRIGLGVVELMAALLLIVPKTAHIGALLSIGIMLGAIASHVFVIGINYNNDGGVLFSLALVTLLCSAIVLSKNKNRVFSFLKRP